MTIDEAIAHARDVAKRRMAEYENHYDKDAHYYPMQCKKCAEEHEQLAEWLEELKQYREIGTVEECRESVGKQTAKKPDYEGDGYYNGELVYDTWICPCCEKRYEVDYDNYNYCPNCGQKLDLMMEQEGER
jgi:hypothetical protein